MATANTLDQVDDQADDFLDVIVGALKAIGSLKITVALFVFSLIIVLVGTLAQDERNMYDVKKQYFTSWVAFMDVDDWFPQAFFPHSEEDRIPGVIPIPGGALIGLMLMINLIAAKATRFRIKASGVKMLAGFAMLLLGVFVGALVIFSGHSSDGLQGSPPPWLGYSGIWNGLVASIFIGTCASLYGVATTKHSLIRWLLSAIALVGVFVLGAVFIKGFVIGEPGLRIVWQLTKGLGVGLFLMIGCLLLFGKQGGNMLLHLGVALLMLGQFIFGDRQLEQRLSLIEGQSSNALVNLDEVELTLISSEGDEDTVTAVPFTRLVAASGNDNDTISDPELPVDIKVLAYFENSDLKNPDDENLATTGLGQELQAVKRNKNGGTNAETNIASAYVELLDKESGDSMGVHLVSQAISDRKLFTLDSGSSDRFDEVTIGDTDYKLGLRFHREVKPYWVQLDDVKRTNYSGTQTPRDYRSFIRIVNPETGEDRLERVWMNNPLRYRGETFFQSSYMALPSGKEWTSLQVVKNSGWLIPYVACSITALGMLIHFLGTLNRFLNRRQREQKLEKPLSDSSRKVVLGIIGAYAILVIGGLQPWKAFAYSSPTQIAEQETSASDQLADDAAEDKTTAKKESAGSDADYDFESFGALPVQYGGRIMPLDSYARQALKAISNRESLKMDDAPSGFKERIGEDAKKMSALQWLMEVAIDDSKIRSLQMFRIDSEEVRAEFGIPRRKSKLYSLDEIGADMARVAGTIKTAGKKDAADRTFKEKKLIELDLRTRNYTVAVVALQLPMPNNYAEDDFRQPTTQAQRDMFALRELEGKLNALKEMDAPRLIPPAQAIAKDAIENPQWDSFGPAFFDDIKAKAAGESLESRPGVEAFGDIIQAYEEKDPAAFNEAVQEHLASVQGYPIPGYNLKRVSLERWMKAKAPSFFTMILYTIALVIALAFLLANVPAIRITTLGILGVTFLIHTVAIASRVYVTGRAPVINIYSSAVFVGWAAVGFGLIIEALYRKGIGNLLSASAGMLTLLVAYGLDSGDTMPVLQAVLDTQFWLTTHVISVSLGYVATLVAGCFGIVYLVANWIGADKKTQQDIYRCCYGTACFGILFSFVGTLLGGLWADDSWGRFWGWDPKENGALLIVIWNALMLHARWDGMVKARGFSVLAIGGNIVTAWSWFGTNELGIGLHSYGFTSGVLMWLSIFVASQLAFIFLGLAFYRKPSDPTPLG